MYEYTNFICFKLNKNFVACETVYLLSIFFETLLLVKELVKVRQT